MKYQSLLTKQNIQWLGIFLVLLAVLSMFFMIMSNRKTRHTTVYRNKPLVVEEIDIDGASEEENLFESLDFSLCYHHFS